MRETVGLLVCVWFLLYGSCTCGYVVDQSSLEVISPESLEGVYEHLLPKFGVPEHGGSIFGRVVYPKTNRKACRNFDEVNISFKRRPGDIPVFLLADRGDCFFTLKARNAQKAGAAAILIVDDIIEPLITMYTPEEYGEWVEYPRNTTISIPSALTGKVFGDNVKTTLSRGEMVSINLDWKEALPHHHDGQIEFEFWTQGIIDGTQIEFIKNFKEVAQMLEKRGYTKFTPHYITWYCPEAFLLSRHCKSYCIFRWRYCALDPKQGFRIGYEGKDVVIENLRQTCFFKFANEIGKPWLWWDYVTDFAIHCSMKEKKYNKRCGDQIIQSFGIDLEKIDKCIGDPNADMPNPVLQTEQEAQIGKGSRGDVTFSPTLIINNRHYRGKLDKGAVLEAICSGFQETSKPAICSFEATGTNVYFDNNGKYWQIGSLEMKDG